MSDATEMRTDRLALRAWRPEEADRLLDIRRREEVAWWLGDPHPWTDRAQAEQAIAEWAEEHDRPGSLGCWAIVPPGSAPAGSVSLRVLPRQDVELEIGWTVHPDSQGRGYAREAAARVLDHAREAGIGRVWAIMWAHNEPSAAVARALGMEDLGVRPDPWYGEPETPDSLMFRIDLAAGSDPRSGDASG